MALDRHTAEILDSHFGPAGPSKRIVRTASCSPQMGVAGVALAAVQGRASKLAVKCCSNPAYVCAFLSVHYGERSLGGVFA